MKAQDYIAFKPFEKELSSAKTASYVRFKRPDFNKFAEVVKQWRGKEVTPNERSCMHGLLKLCKQVAEEYFRYKNSPQGKKIDKQDAADNEEGTTPQE